MGRADGLPGPPHVASSGRLLGIDLAATLRLAEARGCDLAVVSELLQAAEAGLAEAFAVRDPGGPRASPALREAPLE